MSAAEHVVALALVDTDTATHRRREVRLPRYDVLLDGRRVGQVARRMVERERRTHAGRPLASSRWRSPGWLYGDRTPDLSCASRREGIAELLRDAGLPGAEAEALAAAVR